MGAVNVLRDGRNVWHRTELALQSGYRDLTVMTESHFSPLPFRIHLSGCFLNKKLKLTMHHLWGGEEKALTKVTEHLCLLKQRSPSCPGFRCSVQSWVATCSPVPEHGPVTEQVHRPQGSEAPCGWDMLCAHHSSHH